MRCPSSPSKGGSSRPSISRPILMHFTMCAIENSRCSIANIDCSRVEGRTKLLSRRGAIRWQRGPLGPRITPKAGERLGHPAAASLMALGCVTFQTVNHPCLGRAQRDPVLHVLLKRDVELLVKFLGLLLNILFAVELDLIGELSHQGHMLAASAPQRHIALAQHPFAEVEFSEFQENLLDNPFVHQADLLVI